VSRLGVDTALAPNVIPATMECEPCGRAGCDCLKVRPESGFLPQLFKMTLTFEDFPPGHFGTFGPRRVTREEILTFATEFDPQPMHLDEEAAKRSMLNGLAGSGWHLCAIMMRMLFDGFIGRTASLGSPGVNELRWLAPLRPDDELMLDVDVAEARISKSRPETGIVTFKATVRNATGQVLCEIVTPIIVSRRAGVISEGAG
jgi:acyl dehydratase